MQKLVTICLILTILSTISARTCPAGHTGKYNETTKVFECVSCPEGCTKCLSFNGEIICSYCQEFNDRAYFMDDKRTCQRCTAGCEYCTGPTIAQCSYPSSGFHYENSSRSMTKCPTGCNRCDQKGNCLNCLRSYKEEKLSSTTGSEIVKCKPCLGENCAYCRDKVEFQTLKEEVCTSCHAAFGKDGKDKCIACPPYCSFCGTNSSVCMICAPGFTNDPNDKGKCVQSQDAACMMYDDKNFSCLNCKFGHFLDKQKYSEAAKLGCTDCSTITPGCTFCRQIREGEFQKNSAAVEKYRNQIRCNGCAGGFHVDDSTGGCVKNPPFC